MFDSTYNLKAGVVSLEEYKSLAARIQPLIGMHRPIFPGTRLGPFVGESKKKIGLWEWPTSWYSIIHESIVESLACIISPDKFQRVILEIQKTMRSDYFELEVIASTRLTPALSPKPCEACGRFGAKVSSGIIIDKCYDPSIPIQRIVELPTVFIINEELAAKLQTLKRLPVSITPIDVG